MLLQYAVFYPAAASVEHLISARNVCGYRCLQICLIVLLFDSSLRGYFPVIFCGEMYFSVVNFGFVHVVI
jgi:hypothetical protein